MKWFKCLVCGENFPGELIGHDQPVGFCTTQFVQAETPQDAESKAVLRLKKHKSLQLHDETIKRDAAKVYFENTVEVMADEVDNPQQGLSFYPMDE